MASAAQEAGRFLRSHAVHLGLLVPGTLAVTFLHEASHALAAELTGATLTAFAWLPEPGRWGRVRFILPAGSSAAPAISLAPYLVCFVLASIATVVGLPNLHPRACAPTLAALALGLALLFSWAYLLQQRLYEDDRLSAPAFTILACAGIALLATLIGVGL